MPVDRRPSYEEVSAENAELRAMVEVLRSEVAELKRQLDQKSRSSPRQPSSDSPFVKPAPRSLRGKSTRKPGGQPGHPGSRLERVANPDKRFRHEPGSCTGCGAGLAGAAEVAMEKRQVFDLPAMAVGVTEHQMMARRCACGTTTCGVAPDGVSAPVPYGPQVAATVVYLYAGQFLSGKRTARRWPNCSARRCLRRRWRR